MRRTSSLKQNCESQKVDSSGRLSKQTKAALNDGEADFETWELRWAYELVEQMLRAGKEEEKNCENANSLTNLAEFLNAERCKSEDACQKSFSRFSDWSPKVQKRVNLVDLVKSFQTSI